MASVATMEKLMSIPLPYDIAVKMSRYDPTAQERWVALALVYVLASLPVLVALAAAGARLSHALEQRRTAPAGCRRLGMHGQSSLRATRSQMTEEPDGRGRCRVKSLWIYPIKSCRGIELAEAAVVPTGLQYDRQFCLAQLHSPFPASAADSKEVRAAHKWRFITQREFVRLSQVRTELWAPDPTIPSYRPDLPAVRSGGVVAVRFPYQADGWRGMLENLAAKLRGTVPERSFQIPFRPSEAEIGKRFPREAVTIWKESPVALDMSALLPPELRYALGVRNPLGLFRIDVPRDVHRMTPPKDVLGWQSVTGFADAFPMLLLGAPSVRDLSGRQPAGAPPLDARRFRPNVVIEGLEPYAEDEWRRVTIGGREYYVAGRCVRCRVPNVNPDTGERHKVEPDRTLRAERNVDRGMPKKGCLGINLGSVRPEGVIRVGDEITVLERGEHVYEDM